MLGTTVKLEGTNRLSKTGMTNLASLLNPFNTTFISFLKEAFAATLTILPSAHKWILFTSENGLLGEDSQSPAERKFNYTIFATCSCRTCRSVVAGQLSDPCVLIVHTDPLLMLLVYTQPLRDKFGQVYCLKVVVCTLWLRLVWEAVRLVTTMWCWFQLF